MSILIDDAPLDEPLSLDDRIALIRAAKRRREARGEPPELTNDDLDQVLAPVDSLRTRERLARPANAPRRRTSAR
jgi:hypothetical protein